jgi:hypothetical protein
MASISSPISLTTLNHQINLKLSRDNYMLWQYLLASYLEGQNLFGYIDNSIPCPPKFISSTTTTSSTSSTTTTDSPTLVPNPDYEVWVRQDKLILSVIISTISEDILVHIVGLHTSRDIWITLEKMFAAQSKARIMQIRYQLTTLKKGALSVADYFQKVQTLAHTLAAIDEPLKESETISYILAGLSTDYDPLVTSITTRVDPISMEDLYGHLLTHEQRIEVHNFAPDLSSSSVNVAQRHTFSFNTNTRGSHSSRGTSYEGHG